MLCIVSPMIGFFYRPVSLVSNYPQFYKAKDKPNLSNQAHGLNDLPVRALMRACPPNQDQICNGVKDIRNHQGHVVITKNN